MAETYLHVEVTTAQSSKHPGSPCGDVVSVLRTPSATTIVCADGQGSGPRANLAATMAVARLRGLLEAGFTLTDAFGRLVEAMNAVRGQRPLYVAFTLARILPDGTTRVLGYEAPSAVLISPGRPPTVLDAPPRRVGSALVTEGHCQLAEGDALLVVSDGITQAGLGRGSPAGWQADGVARFCGQRLREGTEPAHLPELVRREAQRLWGAGGDDCSAVLAGCRAGRVVTLLTGPPSSPARDESAVRSLLDGPAAKVVCGGTTAQIVARCTGQQLRMAGGESSLIAPPRQQLDGIDLVTEGAVTLNQVCNLLDADPSQYTEESGVTALARLLWEADRVDLLVGQAVNDASADIAFRQRGVLNRRDLLPVLADKLRAMDKLVTIRRL